MLPLISEQKCAEEKCHKVVHENLTYLAQPLALVKHIFQEASDICIISV